MRRYRLILAAAMTAMMITACGSGDGIVINGTTAAEAANTEAQENDTEAEKSTEDLAAEQSKGGTKIEIVTGETTAAESLEGQTEPETTQEAVKEETEAQPTTAAPTRAPETTAARTYTVKDVEKTMYATSSVRIRASYSTSSEVLGALKQGEKIEVTGESENGWMRLNYKGHTAYVSKSYLTETAPSTGASSSQTSQSSGQSSSSGQTSQSSSSGQTNKPSSATNAGTTPGGAVSPGGTTSSGGATSPGGTTSSGGTTSPGTVSPGGTASSGGTTSPGGTAGPGGTTSSSGTSTSTATGTSGSISGSITALDPSGITIQTSEGKSYSFVWGSSNIPALAPGEKIQIQYVTNGSTNTVTQVSK